MATLTRTESASQKNAALDAASAKMARLVEDYYDEIGLTEEERDRRVASAGEFIESVAAHSAKSA